MQCRLGSLAIALPLGFALACFGQAHFRTATIRTGSSGIAIPASPTNVLDSLLLWYKFDDNGGTVAIDSGSYSITAYTSNSPSWSTGRVGVSCIKLDKSPTNFVQSTLPINYTFSRAAFTFWVNQPYAYNAAQIQPVWFIGNAAAGSSELGFQHFSDGKFYMGYQSGGNNRRLVVTSDATSWPQNTWIWFVYKFTRTNQMFYTNGVLCASNNISDQDVSGNPDPFVIGHQNVGANYFNGLIDDFRVYTNLLTDAQIQYLYQTWYAP